MHHKAYTIFSLIRLQLPIQPIVLHLSSTIVWDTQASLSKLRKIDVLPFLLSFVPCKPCQLGKQNVVCLLNILIIERNSPSNLFTWKIGVLFYNHEVYKILSNNIILYYIYRHCERGVALDGPLPPS